MINNNGTKAIQNLQTFNKEGVGSLNFELIKSYGKFKELFEGFTRLRAVTYCNSPELILKLFEDLGYEEVEVFVGDNKSADYRENLVGKVKIADKLERLKEDGKLEIYTLADKSTSDVHSKTYIMDNEKGEVKLICGSPNLTKSGWSGHQKNTVMIIECDSENEVYNEFCKIHDSQIEDYGQLFLEDLTEFINKSKEEKERKEVIEEWLEGKKSTQDGTKELYQKITEKATDISDEEKIKISTLGFDDRDLKYLKDETKDYGGSISGNSFEMPKHGVNNLYRKRYKIPIMRIKDNDLRLVSSGFAQSIVSPLPSNPRQIDKALKKFEKYFELVKKHGKTNDLLGVQSHMFEALLFFFWSPFAHMQARYYKNNGIENLPKHIPFLYIFGESNAGKGTLAKYGLRLISKNTVVDYMEGDELGKRSIRRIKKINTCFPPVIDDIEKTDPPKGLLTNYWDQWDFETPLPPIIFTSNDGKPKKWFKNRSKILHFDIMFEEEKEIEKQLSQVLNQENPLFDWFSYLFLQVGPDNLFCDNEGKLEDDVLAPARKIFKILYSKADRDIPEYFPEKPAEEIHDKGKERWIKAYEDGSISKIEKSGNSLMVNFDVESYEIHKFERDLPRNIRSEKKGTRVEIRNPDDFLEWFGEDRLKSIGLLNRIKGLLSNSRRR